MSGFLMYHDEELMSESLTDLQQGFGRRELKVQLWVIRLDQIKVLPGHSLHTLDDKWVLQ
jgi:hypothetical protein